MWSLGLLSLCHEGQEAVHRGGKPTLNVRYQQVRQRRALAKAVHTLLQSSHVAGMTLKEKTGLRLEPTNMDDSCIVTGSSMRMPGVLMGDDSDGGVRRQLLTLAWWTEHTDLAASTSPGCGARALRACCALCGARRGAHAAAAPREERLIAWYWAEEVVKTKYAAPDTAGFEEDMAAPVFREGALGASRTRNRGIRSSVYAHAPF